MARAGLDRLEPSGVPPRAGRAAARSVPGGAATPDRTRPVAADGAVPVPALTRRLLAGWLALAVGSLVVAGIFAILVAFTRTPAVRLLPSADAFHLSLVAHVTFAFTVWFVAFAGALWVYAAWRANYGLAPGASWAGLALAAAGALAMAVPAFAFAGRPYLNDYVPVIDHPLFWAGLAAVAAGVGLQAAAYLLAWWPARRRAEVPESLGMAVAALAVLLAVAVTLLTLARLEPAVPFGYRLRVLFWGGGHLLQYLHVAAMVSVWLVAGAIAVGARGAAPAVERLLLRVMLPLMAALGAAYLLWQPEALLANGLVTLITYGGLGASSVPLALAAAWAIARTGLRPWGSPLFSATALSLLLFAVGGVMGLVGFSHDTRVPAHYHGMVGAVTMAYMAITPTLLELTGRRQWSLRLARWQPWLYGLGLLGLMVGMHWAGGHGAPRKTFGFGWANAQAIVALNLMGLGSLLAVLGGLAFVANVGLPLLRPKEVGR
jgi:cytochrome c oxidase subunit 1